MNSLGDWTTKTRLLVLLMAVLATGIEPVHAGVIFQFDELGNLAYSLSGAPYVPMANGILERDPTGGVSGDALIYNLTSELNTFQMFNGDVPIGNPVGGLAADLRFTDPGGDRLGSETCGTTQCLMIFYVFDNNGLPADVGSVSSSFPQTPAVFLGSGPFSYSFSYEAGVLNYDGTIVPEPAPFIMLLFGLAGFVLLRKRSKVTTR